VKNITVFAVLVIIIYCAQPVFSQEEQTASYAFSISPQFGFIYGQAEEIVYPSPKDNYKAELLSQLLWDIKPVFYYGLAMDFSRAQPMTRWGFFSNFSLKSGIPRNSGDMEDRDWMSKENTALTNYSIHDNITKQLFLFDASAGFSFPLKHILLMKTYLTVSYMHVDFSSQNGYYIYAPPLGDGKYAPIDNAPKIPIDGKVINYTQEWFIITPGVSVGYHLNTRFYAELVFHISPLISCHDFDEHLTRNLQFRDFMRYGIFIEPGFRFFYRLGERLELSMNCSWRYIGGTRGETYLKRMDSSTWSQEGEAGAGLSVIDTSLCLKVRL